MNESERLRDAYRRKQEEAAPPPWRTVPLNVGGITAVGFGPGTDLLLVQSHSGLGIIDAETGLTLHREEEKDDPSYDPYPLFAPGIGPLRGQRIAMAGLWGGGLRTTAHDGWTVHRIAPNWPSECVVLSAPDKDLEDEEDVVMLLKDVEPSVRGFGFSDSGKSLVVATTILFLWIRN